MRIFSFTFQLCTSCPFAEVKQVTCSVSDWIFVSKRFDRRKTREIQRGSWSWRDLKWKYYSYCSRFKVKYYCADAKLVDGNENLRRRVPINNLVSEIGLVQLFILLNVRLFDRQHCLPRIPKFSCLHRKRFVSSD